MHHSLFKMKVHTYIVNTYFFRNSQRKSFSLSYIQLVVSFGQFLEFVSNMKMKNHARPSNLVDGFLHLYEAQVG